MPRAQTPDVPASLLEASERIREAARAVLAGYQAGERSLPRVRAAVARSQALKDLCLATDQAIWSVDEVLDRELVVQRERARVAKKPKRRTAALPEAAASEASHHDRIP